MGPQFLPPIANLPFFSFAGRRFRCLFDDYTGLEHISIGDESVGVFRSLFQRPEQPEPFSLRGPHSWEGSQFKLIDADSSHCDQYRCFPPLLNPHQRSNTSGAQPNGDCTHHLADFQVTGPTSGCALPEGGGDRWASR